MSCSDVNEIDLADCLLFNGTLESPSSPKTPDPPSIPDQRDTFTSFDMHGSCSLENVKRTIRISKALKPLRLHLLKHVLQLCHKAKVEPFVYGGTALAVYREHGRMIPHDTDIDLAVLEYDPNTGQGALSCIANYCLTNSVSLVGVRHMEQQASIDSSIHVNLLASITRKAWLHIDSSNQAIEEIPYDGQDCKRAKFFFTPSGLKQACAEFGLKPRYMKNILSDPGLVHVDLFTLSQHPANPQTHLRVNWNLPFLYDCNRKQFPREAMLPLRDCVFEHISLKAPANLEKYLTIEYGYLGRDAQYDPHVQLYVPLPSKVRHQLPDHMKLDAAKHGSERTVDKDI